MRRFFVPPADLRGEMVPLPGEVAHHLATVLRLGPGEEILLLDGQGTVCRCRVETVARGGGSARVVARWQELDTAFPLHLLQGMPKGEKFELLLQKGTELGVSAFTPVLTERAVAQPPADRGERRLERWERIVREAAGQCRRSRLPRLAPPRPLREALEACSEELRLVLWEEESRPLPQLLPPVPPRSAALLIGPEGGLTAGEVALARAAGFVAVRFGPRILRTETAGLAAASVLQYLYGDLGRGDAC